MKPLLNIIKCWIVYLKYPKSFFLHSRRWVDYSTEFVIADQGKIYAGRQLSIRKGCTISASGGKITIGNNVFLNRNVIIASKEKITIGNDVLFGPNICVYDHNHVFTTDGISKNSYKTEPIKIGDGTWIGAGAIILPGVELGKNCVVAAGTCLTRGVYPDGSLIKNKNILDVDSIK